MFERDCIILFASFGVIFLKALWSDMKGIICTETDAPLISLLQDTKNIRVMLVHSSPLESTVFGSTLFLGLYPPVKSFHALPHHLKVVKCWNIETYPETTPSFCYGHFKVLAT